MSVEEQLKAELLKHYSTREPQAFTQYDGWTRVEPGDPIVDPDEDGDFFSSSETWELMYGAAPFGVRVLITKGTETTDAVRALRKIVAWIERDGVIPVCNSTEDALRNRLQGTYKEYDLPF